MAYSQSSSKLPSKKEQKEILETVEDHWITALQDQSWRDARTEMVKCVEYKENKQWTDAELKELADRGQPPTVNNQVKVTIDRIVGQFTQIRTRTAYKPRNEVDEDVANAMEDIFTYIKQQSGLEFEERDAFEDGVTGGFGVLEVCIEDEDGDQEVYVKAEDCFNIIPDPRSRRYDWNKDARYIHRYKWVDEDYLQDLYPKQKGAIQGLMYEVGNVDLADIDTLMGESFIDYRRRRVRLIETQYKHFVDEKTYKFSDGKSYPEAAVNDDLLEMAEKANVTYEIEENRKERICKAVWTKGILFDYGVSRRERYDFVPFYCNRKKSGAPYSLITTAIPIQDAINKRESKALALLTMNQATYEEGALGTGITKTELGIQMVKPDGQIVLADGAMEKFRMDKNLELAQSQNQMHLQSKQDFRLVTGVNPDALGEKSEVRSGVGIQRKVAMTGLVIAPIMDNFRRTREALAKTIHDAVKVAYTEKKILNITDNPKLSRVVALDENKLDAVKQAKFDTIISEEEDYDTVHEQQMDILAKSLPQMLQFGPAWAEVLFEMSTVRNKQELLTKVKQVAQQNAPKPQPNMSFSAQLDKLSVPEKIFVYQELGAPPELIQAIQQMSPPPSQVLQAQAQSQQSQVDAQAEIAKTQQATQTEALKAQTEQHKAQTAQVKGQIDLAKGQMDLHAKQQELQMKGQEHAMNLQAQQESHAMEREQMGRQMALQQQQGAMELQHADQQHKQSMKQQAQAAKAKPAKEPANGSKRS